MSAALVLPLVLAMAQTDPADYPPSELAACLVGPEIAFYRKYTEGILVRYLRMSMEAGRVPSLLGKEMFRSKITNYRVEGFDDVVIFVHDVESCLAKLGKEQQELISRITLQQFTAEETANLTGLKPRTIVRRYRQAIDALTRIFLAVEMLEPAKACQGGGGRQFPVSA